ncbi:ABC transporter ATP-binding protein [Cohnella hongkongensis]|uniref:ABC transporter ATP-binding protein n=1 Tax=Cohnella hongkongensis TaxID=178337 RepID=A0ABV9FMS7_9BACL
MKRKQRLVEIENVSFQYDNATEQLRNVSLTIHEGECVVVTGPSGSGKTTLTRIVNGLIPNHYEGRLTGSVRLRERDVSDMAPWDFGRIVGSVFQDSRSQFFAPIVEEEIAFSGENYGMDPSVIRARVDRLVVKSQLTGLLKQEVHRLSSGEKQKVAVASACLVDPELFVMDEPSANLDMTATRQLADQLAALKRSGKTILIAEHRLYYLLPLADRIVYMRDGEVEMEWTPEQLMALAPEEWQRRGLRSPVVRAPSVPSANESCTQERLSLRHVAIAHGRFKPTVLDDINFSVRKGEIAAIVGPNGTGKTTLAKTICGLLKEQAGTIAMDEKPLKAKNRLGRTWFVIQDSDYQLFSDSVLNELMLTHEKEKDAAGRAEGLLRELDLWAFRDRHPASLSGGQKQRLTFAVGLMNRPDLLVLDEPTSGLDGRNMRRVVKLIRQMADTGITVLVITHDYELLFGACDRLLFFQENRLKSEMEISEQNEQAILQLMETMES